MSWDAVEGASGYIVKYRTETGGYTEVNVGRVREYTVTGLSADITYYFTVVAYNVIGNSPDSNELSAIPLGGPSELTVTPVSYTHLKIYRSSDPITSVEGLIPIGTAGVLTGWDDRYYNGTNDNGVVPRFVVDEDVDFVPGTPVSKDTAVYACNPKGEGLWYYAVTSVIDGVETVSYTHLDVYKRQEQEIG